MFYLQTHLTRQDGGGFTETQRGHLGQRLGNRQAADLAQIQPTHTHRERFGTQTTAAARTADRIAHETPGEEAMMRLLHLLAHLLQVGDDTLVAAIVTFEQLQLLITAQPRKRNVGSDPHTRTVTQQTGLLPGKTRGTPRLDRSVAHAQTGVGHDPRLVELEPVTKTVARRTGSFGRVEREQLWTRFGKETVARVAPQI